MIATFLLVRHYRFWVQSWEFLTQLRICCSIRIFVSLLHSTRLIVLFLVSLTTVLFLVSLTTNVATCNFNPL